MRAIGATALVLALILTWACGEGHGTHHSDDHGDPGHVAGGEGLELRLDDGAKWPMDDHTRALFARMTERLEGHGGDHEAAKGLAGALDGDIDELIQGCTMTGDAHNELHKYLMVLIPAVERLASGGGAAELAEVRELLGSYSEFFE